MADMPTFDPQGNYAPFDPADLPSWAKPEQPCHRSREHVPQDAPEADVVDPRQEKAKAGIELAQDQAQQMLDEVHQAFMQDLKALGSLRATKLWARKAMQAETRVAVWDHGRDFGVGSGDWLAGLDVAEQMATVLLKDSVTPTRNAIDRALAEIQGRTAGELLDTIESFRKAWTS